MLSILIPTYNYNCYPFVSELRKQALIHLDNFEILVINDASTTFLHENEQINKLSNCRYIKLEQNIGRSRIRNLLAKEATYDNLLFLDNDGQVTSSNFIKNYIPFFDKDIVVCGGLCYQQQQPEQKFILHWTYGSKREVKAAEKRNQHPYQSFLSCNFLITKKLFQTILFDENLTLYGHEDTLFGIQLKQKNIPIFHIENPIQHIGLEETSTFLKKMKESIINLSILCKNDTSSFSKNIKLVHYYKIAQSTKLSTLIIIFAPLIEKITQKQVHTKHPFLPLLDLYKLSLLCQKAKK